MLDTEDLSQPIVGYYRLKLTKTASTVTYATRESTSFSCSHSKAWSVVIVSCYAIRKATTYVMYDTISTMTSHSRSLPHCFTSKARWGGAIRLLRYFIPPLINPLIFFIFAFYIRVRRPKTLRSTTFWSHPTIWIFQARLVSTRPTSHTLLHVPQ